MNRQLVFLAFLACGLMSFYLIYDVKGKPQREEAEKKSKRLFPELKRDALTSVTIERLKESGSEKPYKRVILKQGGTWVLDGPHKEMLSTTSLNSATRALVEVQRSDTLATPSGPLNPSEFGLDKPTYKVEMKTKDGKTAVLQLGDKMPSGNGYYVQPDGGSITAINTTLAEVLETTEDKLRETSPVPYQVSKVVKLNLTLNDGKTVTVEVAKPREASKEELDEGMEVTDLNEEWKMTAPQQVKADPTKIREFLTAWKGAKHGRFLKPEEKVDFSKPELKVEAFLEGEKEPVTFEVGPVVAAKPNMRYLRRLSPEETMVFEINNPKLLGVGLDSFEQRHLGMFEVEMVNQVSCKFKDVSLDASRKDKDSAWKVREPNPSNDKVEERDRALGELLFEVKGLEWKSKASPAPAFTEVASVSLSEKSNKPLVKFSLGQESPKGRYARVEGLADIVVLEPDPLPKLEAIAARLKKQAPALTPTPAPVTPGVTASPAAAPIQIPIQNGTPVVPTGTK